MARHPSNMVHRSQMSIHHKILDSYQGAAKGRFRKGRKWKSPQYKRSFASRSPAARECGATSDSKRRNSRSPRRQEGIDYPRRREPNCPPRDQTRQTKKHTTLSSQRHFGHCIETQFVVGLSYVVAKTYNNAYIIAITFLTPNHM